MMKWKLSKYMRWSMGDGNNFQYFYLKEIEKIILKNKGQGKRHIFEKDGFLFYFSTPSNTTKTVGLRTQIGTFSHGPHKRNEIKSVVFVMLNDHKTTPPTWVYIIKSRADGDVIKESSLLRT